MRACSGCRAGCGGQTSRRRFLAGCAGAWAAAGSSVLSSQTKTGKPAIDVVFVRPPQPEVVSWPGGNCDVDAQQALFTRTLQSAAATLEVDLRVRAGPLDTMEQAGAYVDGLKQSPADGLMLCAMELQRWPQVARIVQNRGDLPVVVYSNLSAFTSHLQTGRTAAKTLVAATQDVGWLEQGLRMLAAVPRIRNTRLLLIGDREPPERIIPHWGVTIHRISKSRFTDEFRTVEAGAEVRAMAEQYAGAARAIVEPSGQDLVEAARNYTAIRRLLEAEQCQGVSIDCLGWKNPVCIAYSRLMDEGVVAGCEADLPAAVAQLIMLEAFDRPGFIQDPSPNTVNNTLIGSHCTSPTRLKGVHDSYRAPYLLRNYHTRTGVSPQVIWPEGDPVTVVDFENWKTVVAGAGRVVSNIAQPPSGCCRTAVEVQLESAADTRDTKGFHQLFVWGNLERPLRMFGQLAGVEVRGIC